MCVMYLACVSHIVTRAHNNSPFIESLITTLNCERVKSGGAGNKVLMLLEGKGLCYIQDRGVSRWDTCAAQAVLEVYVLFVVVVVVVIVVVVDAVCVFLAGTQRNVVEADDVSQQRSTCIVQVSFQHNTCFWCGVLCCVV
jgi:hypothetical protein